MLTKTLVGRSVLKRTALATAVCAAVLSLGSASKADPLTITGTVGPGPSAKYLLTGSAVDVSTNAIFKMSFETTTPGENLELCAGSGADFISGHCPQRLNDSGGPGFRFLTIVDAASLNGKILYVLKAVGNNAASFSFTID